MIYFLRHKNKCPSQKDRTEGSSFRFYILKELKMSDKLRVGILGGTGMVGQRFITLLENHPWFEVV